VASQVLGAGAEEGSLDCSSYAMDRPTVLVLGNEGYGLRTNVRRACDAMIQVGSLRQVMGGPDEGLSAGVESLNVSVAAGILLHSLIASAAQRNT
jgi:21S rRNA (GM2251-2'-O)-methyltransferase